MTTVNITVLNDADFYRVFQYLTLNGDPIDITGASFVMMLRRHAKDEATMMELNTADDGTGEIVITDALQGLFSIWIKQEELERLGLGDYDQSLIMSLGGLKRPVWHGTFTNNPGPSR